MTATNLKIEENQNVYTSDAIREGILPITAIYGANGAGKTNIISALKYFVQSIIHNKNKDFSDAGVPYFLLDPEFENEETSFDLDFIFEGKHYHYGYALKNEKVVSEWLYSFSYSVRKSRTVLFHRDVNEDEEYYFNKAFKGNNRSISDIVTDERLFLSMASQSKHELCSKIHSYFRNEYNFRFSNSVHEDSIGDKIKRFELSNEISNFLTAIDVGAVRLEVKKVEIDDETISLRNNVADALLTALGNNEAIDFIKKGKIKDFENQIKIFRKDSKGENVEFSYNQESLGTRSIISLLASAFLVLKNGGVFVVDELESSLHTLLSIKVVELFNSKEFNKKGAQLIFTTHETQLLNFEGIRKDEIWLTEKCIDGSTKVSPLSDYSIPKRSNVRNGYLEGRFGAVPFFGGDMLINLRGQDGQEL
ncbi:AAA family ATPase [Vibrio fluvialis]|uniref:AAA family ATPase n=1 Tax=Vibrio fluvialis TaxID=676 RepID=UPI001EEA4A25|nr:ATP-binding protein [Vibrio fluvialis]ELX7503129.1 ATP-binding protein [Vibrio fluvialis]MCG6400349.1 ATP-binding protein [Vibrio fluvialis]